MSTPKTHAERMAELRQAMAAVPEESGPEWEATSYIAVIESALAYADSLAAQLEDERSVNAFALTEQTLGIEDERDLWWAYRDATEQLKAAEEKLRAAERLAEAVRKHIGPERAGFQYPTMREALSAFDAINPDTRRGRGGGVNAGLRRARGS